MSRLKLFMVLLGCKPAGRTIEQHDIFFGIAHELRDLVPAMKEHWQEANGRIHIDAWQEIRYANGYEVEVHTRHYAAAHPAVEQAKLFFINLGGYKPGEFEEYHYKMVVAAPDRKLAVISSKATAFFKHTGYKGARAHIDDKYGIDVDDIYDIEDILGAPFKEKYSLALKACDPEKVNEQHIGYFRIDKI